MKETPEIAEVIVTLRDGRWQRFTASDLHAIKQFSSIRMWELLEFITKLSPPVIPSDAEVERICAETEAVSHD